MTSDADAPHAPLSMNVADVIARTGAETERLFASAQIDRRIVLAPNLPRVLGDPAMVTRILVRMVAGAIRFSNGNRVTVGADQFGDTVEFWVADEGIGMRPEDKQDSFDGADGGFLAWRDQVHAQGGELWIEATGATGVTTGTTVRLSLPSMNGHSNG